MKPMLCPRKTRKSRKELGLLFSVISVYSVDSRFFCLRDAGLCARTPAIARVRALHARQAISPILIHYNLPSRKVGGDDRLAGFGV
ncbi:hypothetical protein [Noviherbaspirillum sp.]|uniref:hypothetical protein n=1 Tax=Noviherbaspirillum sp. TaxID=1926288 RepID=UPI002B48656E|nr:hypothetical protein [Noviherbaspirillum sp.]HJV79982.1 hypothetical protein [Noviherbaspirillum sp.]